MDHPLGLAGERDERGEYLGTGDQVREGVDLVGTDAVERRSVGVGVVGGHVGTHRPQVVQVPASDVADADVPDSRVPERAVGPERRVPGPLEAAVAAIGALLPAASPRGRGSVPSRGASAGPAASPPA